MAIDATKRTKIFQIFGLPQGGIGYEATLVASYFGPAGEAYDFTPLITVLDAKITAAAASATITVQIESLLTRWDAITPTSILEINKSSTGAEGSIVDHRRELKLIAREIANLIGYAQEFSFINELGHPRAWVTR